MRASSPLPWGGPTSRERVPATAGQLTMKFDGKQMDQPYSVDIPDGQCDLMLFKAYTKDGKGAERLTKLTAEASGIRIGE